MTRPRDTAAGTKSLRKLLTQWAVPSGTRDEVAVAVDAEGMLAVIALPWGACPAHRGSSRAGSMVVMSIQEERS
jgi:hypothetical protein